MLIDLFAELRRPYRCDSELVDELVRTTEDMRHTYSIFNEITDDCEIEALIFRMNELEAHYRHLVRLAKLEKICAYGKDNEQWE